MLENARNSFYDQQDGPLSRQKEIEKQLYFIKKRQEEEKKKRLEAIKLVRKMNRQRKERKKELARRQRRMANFIEKKLEVTGSGLLIGHETLGVEQGAPAIEGP